MAMTAENNNAYKKLVEALWRRKLTEAEAAQLRAWLAAHPEAVEDLAADEQLTVALARLNDKPVSADFTARVLEVIEHKTQRGVSIVDWLVDRAARLRRVPKVALATATLVLLLCMFGAHQYRITTRARLAESVAMLVKVDQLPGPDVLIDYDTIRRFSTLPPPDTELLALLK